jgi:hypothetical protein
MRTLWYIPAVMLVVVATAGGMCWALHWNGFVREMFLAALVCAVGAEVGLLPAVCVRRGDHLTISQAALVGTAIEMFLTLVLAALVCLSALVPAAHRNQFVFWLLGFYWMALIALVFSLVRLLRNAKALSGNATS